MLVGWDCKLHKEITEATLYYCSAAASSSSADHQARRPRPSPLILPTICIGAIGGSPSFYSIGIGRYFVLDTKNLISSSRSRYSSSPSSVLSIHLPSGPLTVPYCIKYLGMHISRKKSSETCYPLSSYTLILPTWTSPLKGLNISKRNDTYPKQEQGNLSMICSA